MMFIILQCVDFSYLANGGPVLVSSLINHNNLGLVFRAIQYCNNFRISHIWFVARLTVFGVSSVYLYPVKDFTAYMNQAYIT